MKKPLNSLCNIHDIINNSLNLYDFKNITTINKDILEIPTTILANKNDLISIFLNLIQNADEASNSNGELFISTTVFNSEVMIKIIDSGKGIQHKILNGFGIHFDLKPNIRSGFRQRFWTYDCS